MNHQAMDFLSEKLPQPDFAVFLEYVISRSAVKRKNHAVLNGLPNTSFSSNSGGEINKPMENA